MFAKAVKLKRKKHIQPIVELFTRNNNNIIPYQQQKIELFPEILQRNWSLIIGFLKSEKTYFLNFIQFEKQEPIYLITKSLNQYPNIKAQTSDEIHPIERYKTAMLLLMIYCYQNKQAILICFF